MDYPKYGFPRQAMVWSSQFAKTSLHVCHMSEHNLPRALQAFFRPTKMKHDLGPKAETREPLTISNRIIAYQTYRINM